MFFFVSLSRPTEHSLNPLPPLALFCSERHALSLSLTHTHNHLLFPFRRQGLSSYPPATTRARKAPAPARKTKKKTDSTATAKKMATTAVSFRAAAAAAARPARRAAVVPAATMPPVIVAATTGRRAGAAQQSRASKRRLSPPHGALPTAPPRPSPRRRAARPARALDAALPFDSEARAAAKAAKADALSVGIVGFGTFGRFLAARLVRAGHSVSATSRTDYRSEAEAIGVEFFQDADDFCERHPDVVVLATSILSAGEGGGGKEREREKKRKKKSEEGAFFLFSGRGLFLEAEVSLPRLSANEGLKPLRKNRRRPPLPARPAPQALHALRRRPQRQRVPEARHARGAPPRL